MSEVFLAHGADGTPVVIKLLSDHLAHDGTYRQLLREEAAMGRALTHPNVIEVLGSGDEDGEPFVVLEYIEGVDLYRLQRALQRTQRRMEAPLACYVVREILAGIAHVHARLDGRGQPTVHRDVSPSNVFLSRVGEVKVGDFGIAAPSATGTILRGKLGYMAAEVLTGGAVDHRADLFAAGVVLAEVLLGRTLFNTPQDLPQLLSQRDAQVEQLVEVLSDHPGALVSVVLRALSRNPSERYQTAEAFRQALAPHAGDVTEARSLLSALVSWVRQAARSLARDSSTPPDPEVTLEEEPGPQKGVARSSMPPPAHDRPTPDLAPDPERTVEVPLVIYEVRSPEGSVRGRYTYARLLELAFAHALNPGDLVEAPGLGVRRAAEMTELKAFFAEPSVKTNPVGGVNPDWADALPGCSVLRAIARLVFQEESGLLVAESPPIRNEVYFFKGRPTHLETNVPGESLGEFLVQEGSLKRHELDMALAILPRCEGRLDRALMQLELLEETRLAQLSDRLARDKLMDLFRWRRGTLRFFRAVTPATSSVALTMEPYSMLREGLLRVDDPASQVEPLLDCRVHAAAAHKNVARIPLVTLDHDLLNLADGRLTVRALVQRVAGERRASVTDVSRELFLLLETGALEPLG
ncbi:MAG: serine/threonine protein kinase [Deltaproteobacteria bacterium]|nr:serine/threonine protein kinase [Deltaproteobacteria bacterium]